MVRFTGLSKALIAKEILEITIRVTLLNHWFKQGSLELNRKNYKKCLFFNRFLHVRLALLHLKLLKLQLLECLLCLKLVLGEIGLKILGLNCIHDCHLLGHSPTKMYIV